MYAAEAKRGKTSILTGWERDANFSAKNIA